MSTTIETTLSNALSHAGAQSLRVPEGRTVMRLARKVAVITVGWTARGKRRSAGVQEIGIPTLGLQRVTLHSSLQIISMSDGCLGRTSPMTRAETPRCVSASTRGSLILVRAKPIAHRKSAGRRVVRENLRKRMARNGHNLAQIHGCIRAHGRGPYLC